ncbi:MAG TPA: RNA-binding S4 domain-containing protein [Steroidobacteraceae bacterium]|nr:RNA-binding S4 domain-containing protein [Steroidobacteraceae bacterium]
MNPSDEGPGATRIDRWLFAVRLFKSRSAATDAVNGGKVHLNGGRVKASHAVKGGDIVSFNRGELLFECTIAAIPPRRGSASAVADCYAELETSRTRREQYVARRRLAGATAPRPQDRPDKHGRRLLRRLRGRGL